MPDIPQAPDTSRLDMSRLPRHVAIIMDGNGRWARMRGKERALGHIQGVESVIRVTEACSRLGVEYLTLYGFSTENWNRPCDEVDALMELIGRTIEAQTPFLVESGVRLRIIGDMERLPQSARDCLRRGLDATAACSGLVLTMALSYSGRQEIAAAARHIAEGAAAGLLDPAGISEDTVADHLDTRGIPDPDLLIRTGGEYRISNFLLWQLAYSELYFTPTLWPDFGGDELTAAIADYQGRERRFGKTSDQVRRPHPEPRPEP